MKYSTICSAPSGAVEAGRGARAPYRQLTTIAINVNRTKLQVPEPVDACKSRIITSILDGLVWVAEECTWPIRSKRQTFQTDNVTSTRRPDLVHVPLRERRKRLPARLGNPEN